MSPQPDLYQVQGRNFTAGMEVVGQRVVRHAPILRKWVTGSRHDLDRTLQAFLRSGFTVRSIGKREPVNGT